MMKQLMLTRDQRILRHLRKSLDTMLDREVEKVLQGEDGDRNKAIEIPPSVLPCQHEEDDQVDSNVFNDWRKA